MTQEEKDLLLKDLRARLPYGVKAKYSEEESPLIKELLYQYISEGVTDIVGFDGSDFIDRGEWKHKTENLKPYLRSMSSMTEDEKCQFREFVDWTYDCNWKANTIEGLLNGNRIISQYAIELFNWLNAHHFDYRGLIPMGLALEAPKDMYQ